MLYSRGRTHCISGAAVFHCPAPAWRVTRAHGRIRGSGAHRRAARAHPAIQPRVLHPPATVRLRRRVGRALPRTEATRRAVPTVHVARFADADRSASPAVRSVRRGRPRCPDAVALERLLPRGAGGVAAARLPLRRARGIDVHDRAEDRRRRQQPPLSQRRIQSWRDARQRPGWRRCHRQHADDSRTSRTGSRIRSARRTTSRSVARSTCAAASS